MITIIDYGVGNLNSIRNMLKKIGADSVISSQPADIESAEKLILPGIGSFEYGMKKLRGSAFFDTLQQKVLQNKTPILGVCLGAQLLLNGSEEGEPVPGLGWIEGKSVRFNQSLMADNFKVPHMGWNELQIKKEKRRRWILIIFPALFACLLFGGYKLWHSTIPLRYTIQKESSIDNNRDSSKNSSEKIRDNRGVPASPATTVAPAP